jgi:MSHA biogenesis protein MshQ
MTPIVLRAIYALSHKWKRCAFFVLGLVVSFNAFAISLDSAQLNNASSVSVMSGASVTVSVQASGSFFEVWQSTKFTATGSSGSVSSCASTPHLFFFGSITDSFTVTAPTAAGTYSVTITAYNSSDCSGTGSSQTLTDGLTVIGLPSVVSINRTDANPTSAPSVQWTVIFNTSVTGVGTADFSLANTGLTGSPAITGVSGSGTTYTVTASTGSSTSEGTLGLNLVDDDSIRDSSGTRLGGTGTGNGNFTGQVYTITRPPTVSSIDRDGVNPTSAASVQWDVTFSKSVTGVTPANFTLVKTGLNGTPAITSVIGSDNVWTVTATTSGGNGSLGLNMTNPNGVVDSSGNVVTGLPFTGQVYTISATAPSECFIDSFARANGDPGSDWSVGHESGTFGDPRIVSNRFRLTDASTQASTYATLQRIFPGAGNKIIVEFNDYAYGGSGADGIGVVLSDASIPPVAGAFGGSLGYAPKQTSAGGDTTHAGFAGGWIGVALDEYGNFSNPTEGRSGGPGQRVDSVAIRGSGSGFDGYTYLTGTAANQTIDTTSTNAGPGYRYRITVDHSDSVHAYTKVERDTTGTGNNYTTMIGANNSFDAKAAGGQAAVPTYWSLSFTGSTGGSTNIHEITNLQVCSISLEQLDHIQLQYTGGSCGGAVPVTVKACADASCSHLYIGKVTVNLANVLMSGSGSSSWSSGNTVTFYNGQTQVTLTHAPAGNATINVGGSSAISPPASNATTCTGNNTSSCLITFSAACSFDVVEGTSTTPGTPIYLKLVDVAFPLNLLPIDSSGVSAAFTGTATASLVNPDAASGNCNDTNTGLTSESSAITFDNSTSQPVSFTYTKAQSKVKVRVIAAGVPSCSKDAFAIRPQYFNLTTSLPDCTAGTPPSCSSTVNAGQSFALTANAASPLQSTITSYAGTPSLKMDTNSKLNVVDHAGSQLAQSDLSLLNSASPALPAAVAGVSVANMRYDDVGTITFAQDAVIDSQFGSVDKVTGTGTDGVAHDSVGDCLPNSTSTTQTGGKYGCDIGSAATSPKGRFKVDHYSISASLTPACTTGTTPFTYMGEYDVSSTPQKGLGISVQLQALSSNGVVLKRYTPVTSGTQYPPLADFKIIGDDTSSTETQFDPLNNRLAPTLPAFAWSAGSYSVSGLYSFNRLSAGSTVTPDGSFENFRLKTTINDSDGAVITVKDSGSAIVDSGKGSLSAPTSLRFGRLVLDNASGSDLLSLAIPVRAQYWKSGVGFVTNTDDNCTSFALNSVNKTDPANLTSGAFSVPGGGTSVALQSGTAKLIMAKPTSITGKGAVSVCADLDSTSTATDSTCTAAVPANLPWLKGKWNSAGSAYTNDPKARATFGVYKSGPVIYLRELY